MGVDVLDKAGNRVDIDGIRQVARQAHNNRDVGMVAFTSQGKGSVDIDDDFGYLGKQPALNKIVRELFARFHRSNGVGAGRANAILKISNTLIMMHPVLSGGAPPLSGAGDIS
ncbi:Uncharacterised protein [Klebsiella grimontii]|uniref:Uncharacterized protein n=1 Tax=Klebsiella grimontii TaxID=2058152 RepID=A0A7H4NXT8_9ENTR|nr:Uncharacterised protein [Klebsiella grimontii]